MIPTSDKLYERWNMAVAPEVQKILDEWKRTFDPRLCFKVTNDKMSKNPLWFCICYSMWTRLAQEHTKMLHKRLIYGLE